MAPSGEKMNKDDEIIEADFDEHVDIDMEIESKKKLPRPEEVQQEIQKMMKDKFGEDIKIVTQPMPMGLGEGIKVPPKKEQTDFDLKFEYKPKYDTSN